MTKPDTICRRCGHDMKRSRLRDGGFRCNKCKTKWTVVLITTASDEVVDRAKKRITRDHEKLIKRLGAK